MAELQETIDLRRTQGADAALAIVTTDRGKAEMDAIRAQFAAMDQEEAGPAREALAEMTDAYKTAVLERHFSGLLGIVLTAIVGFLIRRATHRRAARGMAASRARSASRRRCSATRARSNLGDSILQFPGALSRRSGRRALCRRRRDIIERVSTYGVPADAAVSRNASGRRKGCWAAGAEGPALHHRDVPDGYLIFGSRLGRDKPRHLVISPASVDGVVNTVIELGFIRPVDERVLSSDQASESIGVAVRSPNYRAELQNLLEETQRQSEELQVQSEELRVSNEELEEQSRALKESQARLEQQQAELEQTNSQLEEQAQQLEAQRDDLERANAAVQLKARELEQASRYKSDFLANMSHELRTPLNSSLILAKLLADNPDENLTDEQVKFAQTIQSSGNDLLTLINDILDLSKIEAGHVEITPGDVSLERLSSGSAASVPAGRAGKGAGLRDRDRAGLSRDASTPIRSGWNRFSRTCCPTRSSSPKRARSSWR